MRGRPRAVRSRGTRLNDSLTAPAGGLSATSSSLSYPSHRLERPPTPASVCRKSLAHGGFHSALSAPRSVTYAGAAQDPRKPGADHAKTPPPRALRPLMPPHQTRSRRYLNRTDGGRRPTTTQEQTWTLLVANTKEGPGCGATPALAWLRYSGPGRWTRSRALQTSVPRGARSGRAEGSACARARQPGTVVSRLTCK
jgi:hypothetical protein